MFVYIIEISSRYGYGDALDYGSGCMELEADQVGLVEWIASAEADGFEVEGVTLAPVDEVTT